MKYVRLLVVVVLLFGMIYALDQCADTSALDNPATPTPAGATAQATAPAPAANSTASAAKP